MIGFISFASWAPPLEILMQVNKQIQKKKTKYLESSISYYLENQELFSPL